MEGLEFKVAQMSFQLLEFDQWEYYNRSLSLDGIQKLSIHR